MMTFTEAARDRLREFMTQHYAERPALRVELRGSPVAPEYEFSLVEDSDVEEKDVVVDGGGFPVFMDRASAAAMEGATIDFVERNGQAGFEIQHGGRSNGAAEEPGSVAERVRTVIETRINPAIAAHGGRITLVDVKDDVVLLEMSGGCQGCGMAQVTLRQGVERMIRDAVPEVSEIRDVTDHASGSSPYYQPTG